MLAVGCQTVHVREPLPANWAANDEHARSEFWYELAHRPVVTNDEAFHAILLYLDKTDPAPDYRARVATLQSRGMLASNFNGEQDAAADRGTLAVAMTKWLQIRGGLTMRLAGVSPRYAVRALEFRGIYPQCSPNQVFTGSAFVAVMQKAEEYQLGSPADAPAAVLPGHGGLPLPSSPAALTNADSPADPAPNAANEFDESVLLASLPHPDNLDLTLLPSALQPIYLDADLGASLYALVDPVLPGAAEPAPVPDAATAPPAPAGASPAAPGEVPRKRMKVIVSNVEGDSAEVRRTATAAWEKCKVGMVLRDSAEFRTGPKSAIQFIIPPDQTVCLDSDGALRVLDAVQQSKKVSTDVGLEHGRVRFDLARPVAGTAVSSTQPIQIEEAGLEHDAFIRSPHAALALRGTEVSLFEQAEFDPEAMSLTGRALYTNTRGRGVAFGARRPARIHGSQTGAVQQALVHSNQGQSLNTSRTDFETREIAIVIQNGGFVIGNVVVGNLSLDDFPKLPNGSPKLPGALDFVLQWSASSQTPLNDLNLAVFSPLHTAGNPDFVSSPPFIYSLNPNSPTSKKIVAASYPGISRSGGRITQNSVGPNGLEVAYWPKGFPVGAYRAFVFDLVDAKTPPTTQINPVTYTVDVFLNGTHIYSNTDTIGFLQTSGGLLETIPPVTVSPGIVSSTTATARRTASRIARNKPSVNLPPAAPKIGQPLPASARKIPR